MESDLYIWGAAIFAYLMFLIGAIGSFIPVIPGPLMPAIAILILKFAMPQLGLSWTLAIVSVVLAGIAQIIDFAASWLGAKKFGATWRGALGSFVGVFVGIFLPPPLIWIFIAPLVFAFLFEWLGGANVRESAKAGIGAFVGSIAASLAKFLMVVFVAAWFSLEVFS